MANIVALNNVLHKNLKIITTYSVHFGNNVDCVQIFPTEFAHVQCEYPIFFQKHPDTGQFQSIALLGIAPNENLFLRDNNWQARYVPASVSCNPFIIGFEDQTDQGGSEHEPVVYINMDSPRISETQGEPVFREFGGNTTYLENITQNLQALYQGLSASTIMFSIFNELNLIEPVKLEIKLQNGDIYRLQGHYTINAEKLAQLDGASLEKLNNAGVLSSAFFVATSLNNIQHLIDIKNSYL
ncbi:MAG: SapC family protein [Cellvibrio sp.]